MTERVFQSRLIKLIKRRFPSCLIMKNDASYIQGIPDLIILYRDRWAMLECKSYWNSYLQPNQMYYVKQLNEMSYANFINPENCEEVLDEMERIFEA